MNLNEIEAKCFIMALFIRDDGLRFLLGSGAYEFKDSQLMFAGNTIENDVVSVQGNDGYMLAGQVRRPNTQVFDGYIGDASVSKSEVEGYRRDFMAFFQKNHFYTVVYVMADGSAIQRRRGFLVDAPTSQELWQMYPEYHVALNFEDVNYYKYSENDDGEETYGKSADIGLAKVQYGGLIWDNNSEIEISSTGTNITLAGTMEGGAIESVELNGDTEQITYSGKNLYQSIGKSTVSGGLISTITSNGEFHVTGTASDTSSTFSTTMNTSLPAGSYVLSITKTLPFNILLRASNNQNIGVISAGSKSVTITTTTTLTSLWVWAYPLTNGTTYDETFGVQLESGSTPTSFEPYVGGTASPNPDYPQEVQTVTGRQVVTISDGGSQSQEYEINLGKNLCDGVNTNYWIGSTTNMTYGRSGGNTGLIIPVESNTTYTISTTETQTRYRVGLGDESLELNGSSTIYDKVLKDGTSDSVTLSSGNHKYIVINATDPTKVQVEKGSSATTYAPYFTPIELCKIGTYQDYIYKSGEDWYVHKEIGKVTFTGAETETWSSATAATGYVRFSTASGETHADNNGYCNELINRGSQSHGAYEYVWVQPNANAFYIQVLNTRANGLSSFRTWLSTHPATIYYDIAATDTQITNATLISELEDLLSATTYSGNTYITVSGDLASPLEVKVITIGGGGVVWDENGAEWEAGGGGEIVIVNVDSIENILPVWTIRGEAENPTLTNLTTGMSITYNGTVASGQTLVIDLLNKTAKLNGTSVISDVSGQWVEFKPGNNRVSYSTENTNAPDSTIEWQEVVG